MKRMNWLGLLVMSLALALAGCPGGDSKKEPADYPIKGKVTAVNPDKPSVKLDHEDIPGLMKSMELNFDVADKKLLEGLQPGDQVQGRLKAEAGKYVITQLEKR